MPIPSGSWRPRPFRPDACPSPEDLTDLLEALQGRASRSTFVLFERLAKQPPLARVIEAVQYALSCAQANPRISDSAIDQALRYDEYASYCELTMLGLSHQQRLTAERLLCVGERTTILSFFRHVFSHYSAQPYLADMDIIYLPKETNDQRS